MNLTKGRKEPCKNNIGGVLELYLMTYVEYDVRSIVGYRDLLITSFPETQIFKYEGIEKTFYETYNTEGFYQQEVSLKLVKQDLLTSQLLDLVARSRVRAVVVDELGNTKLAGCFNGLDAEIKALTGGGKSDFTGYEVRLIGIEEFKAPFISSLTDSGLTDKILETGCILSSTDRASSMSDRISSCTSLTSKSIVYDCLTASSDRLASMNQLISSCNIAI